MLPWPTFRHFALLALTFSVANHGHAVEATLPHFPTKSRCEALFERTALELAGPRADFIAAHKTTYDIDVPVTSVRAQCQYGSCWVYSTLGELEARILAKTGREEDLSEYFVVAQSLLFRARMALETPGQKVGEEGSLLAAEWLIHKFGVVPEGTWKPKVPFMEEPHSKRLVAILNHLIGRYHLESAAAVTPGYKETLLQQARRDVNDFIQTYSGPLPKAFEHRGRFYSSPLDYAEKIRKEAELAPVSLLLAKRNSEGEKLPESLKTLLAANRPGRIVDTPKVQADIQDRTLAEIEAEIVASLKRGEAVPLTFEIAREFMDSQTGIMSLGAFHLPFGFKPAPSLYRRGFDLQGGGHLVDVVGARLGPDGKVIAYKIKNSWGEKSGDHGFYHMYRDYFEEYVWSAVVRHPAKPVTGR